jgi:hypothetical protein
MKQDKAIIKALKSNDSPELSAGFNSGLMKQIYREVEKKKRRSYILSLSLISTVSLCLIAMAVYLLEDYLSVDFSFHLPAFKISVESISGYGFSFYIAFLIGVLVALDYYFRNVLNKRKKEKFN